VGDALRDAMEELKFLGGSQRTEFLEAMLEALRGSFFSSTPEERNYFGKLSRTYALLFTLKTEPRLVRFFEEMASDFYLYVGADVFVRALSERYLPAEDQKARVMLRMAREAGATLVLAEPVLDEVVNHLRTCDVEYRNYYEFAEGHVTLEIAREAPKILLRAYLYARINPVLEGKDPRSWEAFVNQFCDFATLNKPPAFEQMRRYLTAEFGIEFVSAGEIDKLVDLGEVEELADALKGAKSFAKLAVNDAKLALAVYGRRTGFNEIAKESEFGYRTWWLTSETTILKHTKHLVEGQEGARYMMRPDFLLNFMALAPSAASVRQTYANVFPSVLGVKLAKRMNETVVHEMLKTAKEAAELEPGRRAAKIADLADKLKSDFSKRYIEGFGPTS
jgi:hypothetical protein